MIHHLLDMEDPSAAALQDQMRGGLGRTRSAREHAVLQMARVGVAQKARKP